MLGTPVKRAPRSAYSKAIPRPRSRFVRRSWAGIQAVTFVGALLLLAMFSSYGAQPARDVSTQLGFSPAGSRALLEHDIPNYCEVDQEETVSFGCFWLVVRGALFKLTASALASKLEENQVFECPGYIGAKQARLWISIMHGRGTECAHRVCTPSAKRVVHNIMLFATRHGSSPEWQE